MVFTSALVVIGSLMATLALQVEHLGVSNMLWYLTVVRGLAGVGVGGEFPSGAAVSSDQLVGSRLYVSEPLTLVAGCLRGYGRR